MLNAILHIRKLIEQIQMFHKEEISVQEISQITGTDRKTVKKYLEGDPNESCRSNVHGSLERYTDFIIKSIQSGLTQSTIARKLADLGYAVRIPLERSSQSALAVRLSVPNGET